MLKKCIQSEKNKQDDKIKTHAFISHNGIGMGH